MTKKKMSETKYVSVVDVVFNHWEAFLSQLMYFVSELRIDCSFRWFEDSRRKNSRVFLHYFKTACWLFD